MVNDAKGQTVYRDHLPLLGQQGPDQTGPHRLQIGDQVNKLYNSDMSVTSEKYEKKYQEFILYFHL